MWIFRFICAGLSSVFTAWVFKVLNIPLSGFATLAVFFIILLIKWDNDQDPDTDKTNRNHW